MTLPRPGSPVRGSRSGRPIMAALDLLGRRWTLRLIWELRNGALSFRPLQDACGISPSVLNTRIGELREAGIVTLGDSGYTLTPEGLSLIDSLQPLSAWADRWAKKAKDRGGDGP